VSSQPPWADRS